VHYTRAEAISRELFAPRNRFFASVLPMRISVVIPVFEDRQELCEQGERLAEAEELIVVDASTVDPVQPDDLPAGARLLSSEHANRAYQQNLGAAAASGEALLFLHADTRLPEGALEGLREALENSGVVGGGFERFFDSPSRFLRWTCCLAATRGRRLGWFLGDQAVFVRREVFVDLGGFKLLTAFEDYDLCRRLKRRGRLRCLSPPVISSARRFSKGAVRRSLQDFALTVLYGVLGTRPFRAIQIVEIKEGLEPPSS
ncbi:MAG: glycosyltransferase, partial [Akkermansiaceae bacterium]